MNKVTQEPITPIGIIRLERNDQRRLCDNLEVIADYLPDTLGISLYESLYDKLRVNLPIYHRNEEALFDCILGQASLGIDISRALEWVRHEHTFQSYYADELAEELGILRTKGVFRNPEKTGYMLRFCFETIRQHLAWEDFTLMPLAEQSLTSEDLNRISEILANNRREIRVNCV